MALQMLNSIFSFSYIILNTVRKQKFATCEGVKPNPGLKKKLGKLIKAQFKPL